MADCCIESYKNVIQSDFHLHMMVSQRIYLYPGHFPKRIATFQKQLEFIWGFSNSLNGISILTVGYIWLIRGVGVRHCLDRKKEKTSDVAFVEFGKLLQFISGYPETSACKFGLVETPV